MHPSNNPECYNRHGDEGEDWWFEPINEREVRARNDWLCKDYAAMDEHDLLAISARWRQMANRFTQATKRTGHYHGHIVHDNEVLRVTKILETAVSQYGINGVSRLGRCLRRPDDGHLHWALATLDELDAKLRAEATTRDKDTNPSALPEKRQKTLQGRLRSRAQLEGELEEARLAGDTCAVLLILTQSIEQWVLELKPALFELFQDDHDGEFSRRIICSRHDLRPMFLMVPFVGTIEALDLLEITHGHEKANTLAKRIDAFEQIRVDFANAVVELARRWDESHDYEAFANLDEYRSWLRTQAVEISRYIGTMVAALQADGKYLNKTDTPNMRQLTITKALHDRVPSAGTTYEQACRDLDDAQRTCYRGVASSLREALRETLDTLAPDTDVAGQAGFHLEKDQTNPTMKQKVHYILKSRGKNNTMSKAPEKAVEIVEEMVGALARSVYDRSSLSTHVKTTKQEVQQVKAYVDVVLTELLEIA